MRSLGFKVVDEFSHDRARSEQRIAAEIYAIIRYFTSTGDGGLRTIELRSGALLLRGCVIKLETVLVRKLLPIGVI